VKKAIIAFLVVMTLTLVARVFALDIEAESQVTQIMIYPDSALITRAAHIKLNPGEHKVIFSNIIPEVDENSLRVQASDNNEVKLFGAQLKKEFLEEVPSEKIQQLKKEIQGLEDQIKQTQNLKSLILEEKNFLDSIRLFSGGQIPKDLVTKVPQVTELESILKFLDTKLKDNYSAVMDAEIGLRDLSNKLEVLQRQLHQISGPNKKLKRSIIVDLEALKSTAFDLNVSYLVRGASWQPIYDARANFEKSELEMVSYGIIKQKTGEDWEDVEISLSTAKPAIGGRMPYVAPWLLRPYHPRPMEDKFSGAGVERYQTMALKAEVPLEKAKEAEVEYAQVEEKGIAVAYKLPKKAAVKSDGSEHKLPISTQILKADFKYSAYPRATLAAYLGSRVTNAKDLQLLGGRVNIFLEGDFVGTSSIDNIGPGEEFDLYLGVDENVKVKREQVEKKVDETLIVGIPSPTKRTTFKYKLTVENYKSKKINVKLFEATPVSEDDRIKAKISNVSLEPNKKDWEDRKGVWLWELELEPKQKKEILFTYIIEHPREMHIEGL
jgi:uncharacterized protein (TIGR02231 family)